MSAPISQTLRTESFGQTYAPTWIDRFGVWLSGRRIRKYVKSFAGLKVADFGCGYHASFVRTVLPEVSEAHLIDVDLCPELSNHEKVKVHLGELTSQAPKIADSSLDVVLCISVLEHLWEPLEALNQFHRILKPGSVLLLNVPSWSGKKALELSAFKLKMSPAPEMDDHKNYYDVKDIWPLLVRAGFKPSQISCFPHKFGLNTFAVARK